MLYKQLVGAYQKLENTTKRLEKTRILADFLKTVPDKELEHVMLSLQGRAFPQWDSRETGIAVRTTIKAISSATGFSQEQIEQHWNTAGDLGQTAEHFVAKKQQATLFSQPLSTKKVFENFQKISSMEGQGTVDRKIKLLAELLTSAKPAEAKYIIRTALGELRIGLGEGTLRDAIVWAVFGNELGITDSIPEEHRERYNEIVNQTQQAYDITNDFAKVAVVARTQGLTGLSKLKLTPGIPTKVMLYQKAKNIAEAFKTVGTPAALEYKYDGFRMQIHKSQGKTKIFTRKLEDVTAQFPEVAEIVNASINADNFILDAEAVGYDKKTGKYLPFQNISQRIKRKHDIHDLARKYPVEIVIFDALCINNKSLISQTFAERRKILEKITKHSEKKLVLAKQIITDNIGTAQKFYAESLKIGNEGVMVKNLNGTYKPGSRVGYGVKVKPVMETLDVTITGAEQGEGKRSAWLSSFIISIRNDQGELVEIGRVGSGFKEKQEEGISFEQMSELLKPNITKKEGKKVRVKPTVVIEVDYEEIQKSPTYNSGFALRFPRFVRLREDLNPEDITTLEEVKELYEKQRGRMNENL